MRFSTQCFCAVVLSLGAFSMVGAKPPELPVDEKVNCQEIGSPNTRYDGGVVPAGAVEMEEPTPSTPLTEPTERKVREYHFCPVNLLKVRVKLTSACENKPASRCCAVELNVPAEAIKACSSRFRETARICWEDLKESIREAGTEKTAQEQNHADDWERFVEEMEHSWFAEPSAQTKAKEETANLPGEAVKACSSCVRETGRICWEDLKECLREAASGESACPCPHGSCPKQKETEDEAKPQNETDAPDSVMDDLQTLERARKLFRKAESFRRDGCCEKARHLYEMTQRLYPQSRYDQLAAERLRQFHKKETETNCEEQEKTSPAKQNKQGRKPRKSVEERVAEMLEDCQRAMTDGRYEEAERLASLAQTLDPDCVAANALVYRTHLLTQLEEKRKADREALRPRLPAVDPRIVEVLDNVLSCTEVGTRLEYAVRVEETNPPVGRISDFTPSRFVEGWWTPAGTFTPDLDIPLVPSETIQRVVFQVGAIESNVRNADALVQEAVRSLMEFMDECRQSAK